VELNEIKKALYKQKPEAVFQRATKTGLVYEAQIGVLEPESEVPIKIQIITFLVPLEEIGDASFETKEQSQLLIRYII
jgi:hypothetical protein